MRTTLLIVVIATAAGCAETAQLHRPVVKTEEVYNSPTLWQSFKSIHMARKKKETPVVEKKVSMGARVKRLWGSIAHGNDQAAK